MLATLREPPPRGSAQAYVLQALFIKKDQTEYLRTRAIIQALVNKDAADEALKTYGDAQMPYLPKIKQDDRSKHIQRLMEEVGRGAMSIAPVMQKRVKSKMKTKIVERSEERVAASNRISRKLGGIL